VTEFETELEVFRKEEESAQQFLFAYLSVRMRAASNPDILQLINTQSLFWVTAHHSMLVAALKPYQFVLSTDPIPPHKPLGAPGERVFREGHAVLNLMLPEKLK
jgi:hypothetical protein